MDKIVRRHYCFSGQVQGVGFRYRASHAAQYLGLTGWVENVWDGTVEMEVQGSAKDIAQMISMIRRGTYVYIEDMRCKDIPVLADEYSFRVR